MEAPVGKSRIRTQLARAGTSYLLVANANASGAAAAKRAAVADALRAESGRPVRTVLTASAEELAAIWPDDPAVRVVMLGGDGTVHAVVNAPGPRREFALVPAGRANNIARSLGIPVAPEAAVRLAVTGRPRPIDCIEARGSRGVRRVVEGVSVGFLAQARARYSATNSADVRQALAVGAGALRRFHPLAVTVRQHGRQELLRVAQLFVANLPFYAFGLHVAPQAVPDDGLLDFVALEARGRRSIPLILARLHRDTEAGRREVHCWRAPSGTLEPHGCSPVIADSYDLGRGPVELLAVRDAFGLVTPPW
jgi:diacylglycerol kinase family enzyme